MMKIAGSGSGLLVRGMDPQIRIHTQISWIRNTALDVGSLFQTEVEGQLYFFNHTEIGPP
jgi:hypothetical protein